MWKHNQVLVTGTGGFIGSYLTEAYNTVSKRPDIRKATINLGHNPSVLLEEGLPTTVEWMKSVYGGKP